MKILNWQLMQ